MAAGALARTCIQQAILMDDENPELLNNLAWYSYKAGDGDLDGNHRHRQAAHGKVAPTTRTSSIPTARCCSAPVPASPCIDLLTRKSSITNRSPQLLYNLARAYRLDGDDEFARLAIERCRRLLETVDSWPLRDDRGVFERFRAEPLPRRSSGRWLTTRAPSNRWPHGGGRGSSPRS